jgi:outer membrane protein OmpA-like peptidoglycan-associated protein
MMANARRFVVGVLAALITGCGPKQVAGPSPKPRPTHAMVVLLSDAETGATGRIVVSNQAGSVDIGGPRESTNATSAERPSPIKTLSQAEIDRLFGDAISALPPAPQHFTLFFRFQSDALTDESRALVPQILRAVKDRPDPEVAIVGHTDTMGMPPANVGLGLKRARMVRALLVDAGLAASTIDVMSHGEGDPLIPTPNDTPEPRNRRVEISVK